jgi:hypothetical protein
MPVLNEVPGLGNLGIDENRFFRLCPLLQKNQRLDLWMLKCIRTLLPLEGESWGGGGEIFSGGCMDIFTTLPQTPFPLREGALGGPRHNPVSMHPELILNRI